MRLLSIAAAAFALALAAPYAGPAHAQPMSGVSSADDARQMARETAHRLFSKVDYRATFLREMPDMSHVMAGADLRPEWPRLMQEALDEEIAAAPEILERVLGDAMADYFTVPELRVGLSLLRGPAGDELAQVVADSAAHRTPTPFSPAAMKEFGRLARDPVGRRWAEKFGAIGGAIDPAANNAAAEIGLGVLRRFLDKAEALEATHRRHG